MEINFFLNGLNRFLDLMNDIHTNLTVKVPLFQNVLCKSFLFQNLQYFMRKYVGKTTLFSNRSLVLWCSLRVKISV